MNINIIKSFAKINLALHVTGKLSKLHKIESIIKFIKLHMFLVILYGNKSLDQSSRFLISYISSPPLQKLVDNILNSFLVILIRFLFFTI